LAAVPAEVAVEHNPVADYSEVHHPTVAAGLKEVDPMADVVGVVQAVERRIAGRLNNDRRTALGLNALTRRLALPATHIDITPTGINQRGARILI
jgi:hypothetical protein